MIRFLPIIVLFLFSCSEVQIQPQPAPETTIPDTTVKKTVKKVNRIYFDFDFDPVHTLLTDYPSGKHNQILINYEFYSHLGIEMNIKNEPVSKEIILKKANGQILPLHFSNEQFLSGIFGNKIDYAFDQEYSDSIPISWWTCKNCIPDSIPYFSFTDWGDVFPGKEINTSFVDADYSFSFGKRKLRFISFVSYPNEFAVSFCGRFSGGVMGYALFEETETESKLLDLNYKVGMFGNYNQPKGPELRIAYDQLILIYQCTNGGAGGPYSSISQIWQLVGNEFIKLTEEKFLTLNNTGIGEWETSYQFCRDSVTKDVGIKLITAGYFVGYGNGEIGDYIDYFYDAPKEFMLAVKDCDITKRPFEFVLERTRILKNGRTIKTQKFNSMKLKGEWVTEYEE